MTFNLLVNLTQTPNNLVMEIATKNTHLYLDNILCNLYNINKININ